MLLALACGLGLWRALARAAGPARYARATRKDPMESESLADIRRMARAALEFSAPLTRADGTQISVTVRLPTTHQNRLLAVSCERGSAAFLQQFQRALLLAHVVGWAGVQTRDLLSAEALDAQAMGQDARAALVPWESGAVDLLLDANAAWDEELGTLTMVRLAERNQQLDTATKN